jgi:beta-lactamase regulating signal transducer with metallopeptidase domain/Tfp pilus assembly protein PilF
MTAFWSAIINSAILSTLLSLAVRVVMQIIPRRALNAATRYAIWWIVLVATLVLPLAYIRLTLARPAAQIEFSSSPRELARAQSTTTVPVAKRAITLPLEIPASQWLQPLLIFWIATSLLLLARAILSYAALYRRSARAADVPPGLRARLASHRRRIRIAISDEIEIPMAVGPFRPAILIPARLFATIADTDLDQICRHEAAHLARRDDYTLFLQRITEAVFFLHPLVRWVTRQLDLEREIACDDAVARSTDSARTYADCLTRMVITCGGVRPSLAAANAAESRSHLSRRVELLLRPGRNDASELSRRLFAGIALALILAVSLLAKTPRLFAFSTPPVLLDPPLLTKPVPPQVLAQATPLPPDDAIATLNRRLRDATDNATRVDLYVTMGETYRQKGDFNSAINAMEQAAALAPDNASVFTELGLLYDAQHNFPQARRNYERALAINPNNPLVLNNLAYMLAETGGDLNTALTYARTAQQKLPNFYEVNDTIGWIYLKQGLVSDAVGAFKILTDARPDVAEFHYHYALALLQQDNRPDAFLQCKMAELKNPAPELEKQIRALMDKIAPLIDSPPDYFLK